jgi:hypothetical protein
MFEDYDWKAFGIAFVLLAVLPVWILGIFIKGFFMKILATIVLGIITFIAIAMKKRRY